MIPGVAVTAAKIRPTRLSGLDAAPLLALVLLLVVCSLLVSGWMLAVLLLLVVGLLTRTGLGLRAQLAGIRPWLPLALVVVLIHAVSTTGAAPLGHFSWAGVLAGLLALVRIGTSLAWMALFSRLKSLDEIVRAVCWWLRPLQKLGVDTGQLALVLAVALGTVPKVMNEGRRVEAVLRMRRSWHTGPKVGRWRRFTDRAAVVVPLVENLKRRADVLTLSLASRQPRTDLEGLNPPFLHFLPLVLCLLILMALRWSGVSP